jgi:hypothetical protein
MRSRAARLSIGAVVLVAVGAAVLLAIQSEQQIASARAAWREFDAHARDASDALADVRVAQAAYVAAGQGVAYWMPKVASITERVMAIVSDLKGSATGIRTRSALEQAEANVDEFASLDKRARDYIAAAQPLMAGDMIFTEGSQTAAGGARQIQNARDFERDAISDAELAHRKEQAILLGSAGGVMFLAMLLLIPLPRTVRQPEGGADVPEQSARATAATPDIPLRGPEPEISGYMTARPAGPVLKAAATLCTDLGRVSDLEELRALLARASDVMDASGAVVWLAAAGNDLQPALSHGYAPQVMARMPSIPRSADNAAAAAYRTGQLQIVLARPGSSNGAIVAPLLSSEGCIGALSAEIRGGGETSDSVQALAAIFAAQLAAVLHAAPVPEAGQSRMAQEAHG